MAGEAQQIQAKVYVPGKGPGSKVQRPLTLEMISEWIRLQGFDEYTTNGLIELAGKYPTQALPSFRRNFNLMIQRVRAQRKKEQNLLVAEEPVTEIGELVEPSPMDDWQNEEQINGEGKSDSGGDSQGQRNQDETSSGGNGSVIYV